MYPYWPTSPNVPYVPLLTPYVPASYDTNSSPMIVCYNTKPPTAQIRFDRNNHRSGHISASHDTHLSFTAHIHFYGSNCLPRLNNRITAYIALYGTNPPFMTNIFAFYDTNQPSNVNVFLFHDKQIRLLRHILASHGIYPLPPKMVHIRLL